MSFFDGKINIRLYLIIALGKRKHMRDYINSLYDENKLEYYLAYKQFEEDINTKRFLTPNEEAMRKVAGIVNWCYNNDQMDLVFKLIKKGYSYIYNYVTARKVVDLEDFIQSYHSRLGKQHQDDADYELFLGESVCFYLCHVLEKDTKASPMYRAMTLDSFEKDFNNAVYSIGAYRDMVLKQHRIEIEVFRMELELPKPSRFINMGSLIEFFIRRETERIMAKERVHLIEARHLSYKQGIVRHIFTWNSITKVFGVHDEDLLTEFDITDDEIDFLCYMTIATEEEMKLPFDSREERFIAICYYYSMHLAYKQAKALYLDNSKEELYVNLVQHEEELRETRLQIESEKEKIEKEKIFTKQRMATKDKAISDLELEVKRLKLELEETKGYKKEVVSLREYAYRHHEKDVFNESVTLEQMKEVLSTKNVVVVGGFPDWIRKLEQEFPSFQFAHIDTVSRKIKNLNYVDYLFLNVNQFNHPTYYAMMNHLNKYNTKPIYLSGYSNIERTIREMYEAVMD
jgi:hypothetical protein